LGFVGGVNDDHRRKKKGIERAVWRQCGWACAEVRGAVENLWNSRFTEETCGF
jgi:hypothetical protein